MQVDFPFGIVYLVRLSATLVVRNGHYQKVSTLKKTNRCPVSAFCLSEFDTHRDRDVMVHLINKYGKYI